VSERERVDKKKSGVVMSDAGIECRDETVGMPRYRTGCMKDLDYNPNKRRPASMDL